MQPSYPPQGYDPYNQQKKSPTGWLIGGGILFAALLGFGIGTGFFGLMGGSKPALNQQGASQPILPQTQNPAPVFMQEAQPAPITPQEAKRMPQDILDWLKHLEETERRRRSISNSQMGQLAVQMAYLSLGAGKDALQGLLNGDPDALENKEPMQDLAKDAGAKRQEWSDLNAFFKSYPPPDSCVPIYNSYSTVLQETGAMMLEVLEALSSAQENPEAAIGALNGMKGDSSSRIDVPAHETDRGVQQICDEYETRKWFSISSDFGSGLMGQMGGLPNMSSSP
jgi:hypothetical protein